MQLVQAHGPRADLAEGGVGLRECDMLRVLHAVLAFDKGYQSEGLQLLAWHIGARNARRGRGSREISQEDSRENSSLSKCHCSANPWNDILITNNGEMAWEARLGLKLEQS